MACRESGLSALPVVKEPGVVALQALSWGEIQMEQRGSHSAGENLGSFLAVSGPTP